MMCESGGRARNEDAGGYWHSGSICCAVVADGAGGHGGGDVASKLVVEEFLRGFARSPLANVETLERLIREADHAVLSAQAASRALEQMRTTVAVLAVELSEKRAVWAHLGDTRIYHFRAGSLLSRTRDHSTVESMVQAGYLSEAQARKHPNRNVLQASLGDGRPEHASPVTDMAAVDAGDALLLCSDGLWELLDDEQICQYLRSVASAQDWLAAMQTRIKSQPKRDSDNYSAVAVLLN